jgi:peptidyl-prolyl cis-trans isomerase SurA
MSNIIYALQLIHKKSLFITGFLLFFLTSFSHAEIVDKIIAVVNDDVITMSELEEHGKIHFQNLKKKIPEADQEAALQKARMEVRESLIDKYLVSQKAKKMQITVTPQEIDDTFDNMVAKSGLTKEKFLEKVKLSGHSESSYRDNLMNQMLQSKIINYDVRSKVIVTEKMVRDHFNEKYLKEDTPGGFYLLQMGFIWKDTSDGKSGKVKLYPSKEEAAKQAQSVHKLASEGKSFKDLAQKYSNLPSSADGGDIGLFQEDELAPFMREAITNIKTGEITPIIETETGYQFFKLQAIATNDESTFETMKEEIREDLYEKKLTEAFDAWVIQLKEGAYIKRL